ncbi:MAG: HEPN domain-containing protein [Bacteroidetes bacterium]|nr:HEPN domain-containing protein [Bacteroidota bacterium]
MIFEEPKNSGYFSMKDLISFRMEKSHEAFTDAQNIYKTASYNLVVNRLYYAVFYMVSAVLLKYQLSGKTHKGIKTVFQEKFVKKGIIPKKISKIYDELFKMRNDGDYEDFVIYSKEKVEPLFDMVSLILSYLTQLIDQPDPTSLPNNQQ